LGIFEDWGFEFGGFRLPLMAGVNGVCWWLTGGGNPQVVGSGGGRRAWWRNWDSCALLGFSMLARFFVFIFIFFPSS